MQGLAFCMQITASWESFTSRGFKGLVFDTQKGCLDVKG